MNNASGTTDLINIYTRTAPKSPSPKSRNAHLNQDLSLSNMYVVMRSYASYSKKIGVSLFILIWLSVHESPLHRYPLEADHFGLQVRLFKSPFSFLATLQCIYCLTSSGMTRGTSGLGSLTSHQSCFALYNATTLESIIRPCHRYTRVWLYMLLFSMLSLHPSHIHFLFSFLSFFSFTSL